MSDYTKSTDNIPLPYPPEHTAADPEVITGIHETAQVEDISDTISTTDQTGLMQSQPEDEAEANSYSSVYNYEPPKL